MRQAKLLLIEDEADVLMNNKRHLERQGYQVECAATLSEARASLYNSPPDLVLLDVMLPDGSGYDFLDEIRSFSTAPVIYLTCLDKSENIIRGLIKGGDDYITKPFDLNVLSARVIAQLRRTGLSGAGKLELPPLSIDLQKGRIVMNGEMMYLPQKELQLLTFFASHAGQYFTPEEIYEEVWDGIPENINDTVKMRISSIRKKLRFDAEGSPFDIRYRRGKGYVFKRLVDEPEW